MQQTFNVIPETLSLSGQFAHHWCGVSLRDLPIDVVHQVKQRLLDTIAAGIAGIHTDETNTVRDGMAAVYGLQAGAATATLWGSNQHLPAPQAALVNGTASHARELDDFDGCGHTGAVVIPAVLAVAQACSADGASVLTAIAAGYDFASRMLDAAGGYRPHNGLGWHSTATCGTFGAALAAAKVLGLNAEQTTNAIGIAGTFVGGVWAFMQDGAMTKRMHPGKAAETGVAAAYLARAGMTGPAYVLESDWGGFFKTYCGTYAQPHKLLEGLGVRNGIASTGIKPYACCRGSHGAIDALLQLMQEHHLQAADITHLDVHCSPHTAKLVSSHRINNVLDAQMSMPYALAVTALAGNADLPQFTPPQTSHPEVQRLMQHTALLADLPTDHIAGPIVDLHTTDGRLLKAQVQFAKGHPKHPITDAELHAKAQSLIAPQMGQSRCDGIEHAIAHLQDCSNFRSFSRLLQAPT